MLFLEVSSIKFTYYNMHTYPFYVSSSMHYTFTYIFTYLQSKVYSVTKGSLNIFQFEVQRYYESLHLYTNNPILYAPPVILPLNVIIEPNAIILLLDI